MEKPYMTGFGRRDFLTAAAGALVVGGCSSLGLAVKKPEPDFIWSYLAHFGVNSWKDFPYNPPMPERWLTNTSADHVRFSEASWRRLSDALAKAGCNQIVIDLAEIVQYPSHPELAVKGSWSVEKLRAELDRLRVMGFEVIPKMNFSATHDTWLKDYHRMLSTEKYYQVCEDLIKDVVEIFDHPRFFHLGYDEESFDCQKHHLFAACRQGDLWWHDFLWFVKVTEKAGSRPWIWSDYSWYHKDEFLKRMPKSVLQSNWHYNEECNATQIDTARYLDLDKAGFDQVPAGSNWLCNTNFANLVKFCDENCSRDRIKGYMMTTWLFTLEKYEARALEAVAQMESVIKARKS